MMISENKNTSTSDLKMKDVQIRKVKEFRHLNNKINQNGKCKREIKSKITRVKNTANE